MKEFYNAVGGTYTPMKFLTFDDVILQPQYSQFQSRFSNDIKINQCFHGMELSIPIVSSNMDTITGLDMAQEMDNLWGMGFLHRFHKSADEYEKIIIDASRNSYGTYFSVGLGNNQPIQWIEKVISKLPSTQPIVICVDVAHGHSQIAFDKVAQIRDVFPYGGIVKICVGNIATREAAKAFIEIGVEFLKVGIGCGSICQTRVNAGHGVPQMTAIMQVRAAVDDYCTPEISDNIRPIIIADGGIRSSGDVVKALAAGAELVMVGSMLSGTKETPGDIIKRDDGTLVKKYRGQSSKNFMKDNKKEGRASEGISTYVPYKGNVSVIIDDIIGGLRSGMSYSGCSTIAELYTKSRVIEVSHAGLQEGHTHILNQKGSIYDGQ